MVSLCGCLTSICSNFLHSRMGVSKNRGGPPKSSILIGFSIINHPFWGTRIFGNNQISLLYVLLFSHKWQVLILKIKSSINLTFRSIEFRKFHTLIVGIISQVNKKNNGYFSQLQKKPLDHPENPELKGGKKWEFRRMVRCQKNPSTSHDAGGHCYSRHVPEPRKTLLLSIKLVV